MAGGNGISVVGRALEMIGVIGLAAVHLAYSIGVSVAVIVRSATAPVIDKPLIVPIFLVFIAFAGLMLLRVRLNRSGNTVN